MKFINDFHKLYNRHAIDVYRFALFLCGDEMEAEDITSETFARAITGKVPLMTTTVKGYLLTIARNLHLESQRKKRNYSELPSELPDSNIDLEHLLIYKNELDDLQAYLKTFPEVDRSALLLRADGLRYEDIAKVLNISLALAKVKVHRVRLKLTEWRANRSMK